MCIIHRKLKNVKNDLALDKTKKNLKSKIKKTNTEKKLKQYNRKTRYSANNTTLSSKLSFKRQFVGSRFSGVTLCTGSFGGGQKVPELFRIRCITRHTLTWTEGHNTNTRLEDTRQKFCVWFFFRVCLCENNLRYK